jgi:hypothetical protein
MPFGKRKPKSPKPVNEKHLTAAKQRNAQVRLAGLRPFLSPGWIDPRTHPIIIDKMLAEMRGRYRLHDVLFFLREPMLAEPKYLVAAWRRGKGDPCLMKLVETPEEALHEMQQVWREAVLECHVGGDDDDAWGRDRGSWGSPWDVVW